MRIENTKYQISNIKYISNNYQQLNKTPTDNRTGQGTFEDSVEVHAPGAMCFEKIKKN
jgi:hypothetical protein